MKRLLCIFFMLILKPAVGQDSLSLADFHRALYTNYPLIQQVDLISQKLVQLDASLKAEWYPQFNLSAQATYQSDIIAVDLQIPNVTFPAPDKDQYKMVMEIKQIIYDGGRIRTARDLEQHKAEISKQEVEVEMNKLKSSVNQLFFNKVLLDQNKRLVESMMEDLRAREEKMKKSIEHGILREDELLILQAEMLRLQQQLDELEAGKSAATDMLAVLTGLEIGDQDVFVPGNPETAELKSFTRPEQKLFQLQSDQISHQIAFVKKQNHPNLFAFAQMGYGKPGLNMLGDSFDTYYYLGAGLSWKIWDWRGNKKQRNAMAIDKKILSSKEEAFLNQLSIKAAEIEQQILGLKEKMKKDEKIIELHEKIVERSRLKLDNGTITANDYLERLREATRSGINWETHKVKLIQAQTELRFIYGQNLNVEL